MATLTIRNLPDELHERLKLQAKQNRRSLNQEVIADLVAKVGSNHDEDKRQRVLQMIALAGELRKELKVPLTAEEIREGINEGRK